MLKGKTTRMAAGISSAGNSDWKIDGKKVSVRILQQYVRANSSQDKVFVCV